MLDKTPFDPEKLSIVNFKLLKGQIDEPEEFAIDKVQGHYVENGLKFGTNLKEKLVKVDYTIEIKTDSNGENIEEASGNFHLVYVFKVENLQELAVLDTINHIELDSLLSSNLASISHSTSRGILLTRLQGTAFQNFILPVIATNKLINKSTKK